MKNYLLCGLFVFLFLSSTMGQPPDASPTITIEDVSRHLRAEYDLRLFYEPSWFEASRFPAIVLQLPLEELLSRLVRERRLTHVILDEYVVFLPVEARQAGSTSDPNQVTVVGNMSEYGKYSHPTVQGQVLDGQTGEPLVGAILQVEAAGLATTTGVEGDFSLKLPVGEHVIRLSYVGYQDTRRTINLVSNGTLLLELFEQSLALGEVVVSARRADSNISQAQMSQLRLDAQTIAQLPTTFGEVDVIRSVTLMPGVLSMGEFGTGFNVRGGSADQNLILVEGMPLFNSSHLFGLISLINPDLVSNITLIKGGIPARFGERASSVMDIRLGANQADKLKVSGGLGLLNNRLSLKTPLFNKNASLALGGRLSYTDWMLHQMPDVDLMNSSANFHDLSGVFSTALGARNNLSVFGYYSNDGFALSNISTHAYSTTMASLRWNYSINADFTSTLTAGFSGYDYQITEDRFEDNAYKIQTGIDYQTAKWNLDYRGMNQLQAEVGLQGTLYDIQPGSMTAASPESVVDANLLEPKKGLELAAYASADWELSDQVAAEMGLRYSRYHLLGPATAYTFQEGKPRIPENISDTLHFGANESVVRYHGLEPRLSIRYTLNDASSLKASYNRINQYISLLSNTSVAAPADVWELSSYNIKPLVADQVALGYFHNFLDNTIETSVEVYYKNLKNVTEVRGGAQIMMNEHIESHLINAQGYNYGVELYARKEKGRLSGWASYTWSVSKRRSQGAYEEEQINGNRYFPSNFDQPHNFIVNANFHISRRWRFNGNFTYNTGRPVTLPEVRFNHGGSQLIYYSERNKYRLPDYHRLDISITYGGGLKLEKAFDSSFTVALVNVYGRKNPFSVFYQKEVPGEANNFRQFSMYQLYIIGRPLPTFTYTFRF